MRRTLLLLALCAALPAAAQGKKADPLVERGRYITKIGGCNDCHTPNYAQSGGKVAESEWLTGDALGWRVPWGTTYPSNLRLRMQQLTEAQWLEYSANLRTRPMMPDFAVRAMTEEDRRAIYRFIHSLGAAGQPAPEALPPGQTPPAPYLGLVLPTPPADASAAH